MATSKNTTPAQLRRAVEERTGTCQNMKQFGFVPVKYTLGGEPTRFTTMKDPSQPGWVIARTFGRRWRVAYRTGHVVYGGNAGSFYPEKKVDNLTFPGPVAAAIWVQVEKSNGSFSTNTG